MSQYKNPWGESDPLAAIIAKALERIPAKAAGAGAADPEGADDEDLVEPEGSERQEEDAEGVEDESEVADAAAATLKAAAHAVASSSTSSSGAVAAASSRDHRRHRSRSRSRSRSPRRDRRRQSRSRSRSPRGDRDRHHKSRRRSRSRSRSPRRDRRRRSRSRSRSPHRERRGRSRSRSRSPHRERRRSRSRSRSPRRDKGKERADRDPAEDMMMVFTAAQVAERFLETFTLYKKASPEASATKAQRALDNITECFSKEFVVGDLETQDAHPQTTRSLREHLLAHGAWPSSPSARVFVESVRADGSAPRSGSTTFSLDLCPPHRGSCFSKGGLITQPSPNPTFVLYRVRDNAISGVYIMEDTEGIVNDASVTEEKVFASAAFMAALDLMIRPGGLVGSSISKYFHNYNNMVTLG